MGQPQAEVQAQPQPHCYAQAQPSFPSSSNQLTAMPIALSQPQPQAMATFPAQPQPQSQPQSQSPPSAASSSSRQPEHLMYKNRLQEFTHKSNIPLPVYHTVNEASPHAPMFRATVLVDGVKYTSPNTFSTRKAAEQDVAELALKYVSRKKPDEGFAQGFPEALPLVNEDTIFCKSILNEFVTKMNVEIPTYNTIKSEGLLPVFISSLVFNGVSYTGRAGKNKKEAEQLAARAVILSLLGDSKVKNVLHDIIKSKVKLYAAFHKVNNLSTVPSMTVATRGSAVVPGKDIDGETGGVVTNALTTVDSLPKSVDNVSTGVPATNVITVDSLSKSVDNASTGVPATNVITVDSLPKSVDNASTVVPVDSLPQSADNPSTGVTATRALTSIDSLTKPVGNASAGAIHGWCSGNGTSKHEFIAQKPENSSGAINLPKPASQASNLPIEFVHPTSALTMETGPSSKKRRKNKKKAKKRLCTDAQ